MKATLLEQKRDRAANANEVIAAVAMYGHQFFNHPKRYGTSYIRVDDRGRVWFVDGWTGKSVYLHYAYWQRGFSEGGTLRQLIIALKDYITTGEPISRSRLGPWPDWYCDGDPWGYGDDMQLVRDCAVAVGVLIVQRQRSQVARKGL